MKYNVLSVFLQLILIVLFFTGCDDGMADGKSSGLYGDYYFAGEEEYKDIDESPFIKTDKNNISYVSLDANTASYTNVRRQILMGQKVNKNSIRIEEMINYFNYESYLAPVDNDILSLNAKIMDCPWNSETKLLSVGLKTKNIEMKDIKNNLVFLIDVSGSMDVMSKIGLIREAFPLLVNNLNDDDYISIVTYASHIGIALEGARGTDKNRINNILSDLTVGGSTSGAAGLELAYQTAGKYFIKNGNNRVILATDGDFNVGINSESELENFIKQKKETGIYLSVLGFGYGNLKDNKLESLAKNGNGNYAYINSLLDAKKVFIDEAQGTLVTVAKDVKARIEFNKTTIEEYRLIGYDNKRLTEAEYEDNSTDAGDLGAGNVVTVVFEVKIKDMNAHDYGTFAVKYKDTQSDKDLERIKKIGLTNYLVDDDIIFISAIAEFGLLLRDSVYKKDANFNSIISRIEKLDSLKNNDLKNDFFELIKKAKTIYQL